MMGDSEYDHFEDGDTFEPRAYYYDEYEQESSDSETLLAHGFKLISYEYPTPIENSFVFSHLSYFSGEIVLPLLLICLVALIVTVIAVKKEKDLRYNAVDVISIILNFAVSILLVPFTALVGMLIDIEGGGPELYHQLAYFISPISMLSVVCSIALRRKGNRISSLIATLVGPVAFALYLLIFGVLLML
jgi:hypothetical protein